MKRPLPLIISIPHGGTLVPEVLKDNLALGVSVLLEDGDIWTSQLFNFGSAVKHTSIMPIARAVLDLNRASDDLPPGNFDGVIKTQSLFLSPVWRRALRQDEIDMLLTRYYQPYYETLKKMSDLDGVKLGIDCHSMLPQDPFDATAAPRPLFCLSNRGNASGEQEAEPLTAPADLLIKFKMILESTFGQGSVGINTPFKGGELTRRLGREAAIPWFQFEVNRNLYAPFMTDGLPLEPVDEMLVTVNALKMRLLDCLTRLMALL